MIVNIPRLWRGIFTNRRFILPYPRIAGVVVAFLWSRINMSVSPSGLRGDNPRPRSLPDSATAWVYYLPSRDSYLHGLVGGAVQPPMPSGNYINCANTEHQLTQNRNAVLGQVSWALTSVVEANPDTGR